MAPSVATCLHQSMGRRAFHSMKILHVLHNSLPLLCGYSIRSGYIVNLQRTMGLQPWVVTSGQHPNGRRDARNDRRRRVPAHCRGTNQFSALSPRVHADAQPRAAGRERGARSAPRHHPRAFAGARRAAGTAGCQAPRSRFRVRDTRFVGERRGRSRPLRRRSRRCTGLPGGSTLTCFRVPTPWSRSATCSKQSCSLEPAGRKACTSSPNGVDAQAFAPQAADNQLKERWKLAGKEVILYAGTFQPYEGLDLLVRAIGLIAQEPPVGAPRHRRRIRGFAHGTGSVSEEERELLAVVRETGVADHVTFTGRIPHAEVKGMYAMADVVALSAAADANDSADDPIEAARSDGDGEAGRRQRCGADARARERTGRPASCSAQATSSILRRSWQGFCAIRHFASTSGRARGTGCFANASGRT